MLAPSQAELLGSLPEIIACDRVTGNDCFIAKALVAGVADLEKLIDGLLPFATTNTSVIVSETVAQRMPGQARRERMTE